MSLPIKPERKGPKKNYFAIDNHIWEAMLYRFRVPRIDQRVFGWIVRFSYGIQFNDRTTVNREKVAEHLGISTRHVDRAIQSLLKHGAIRPFAGPQKGKHGVYGPVKQVWVWTYPLEDGSEDWKERLQRSVPTDEDDESEQTFPAQNLRTEQTFPAQDLSLSLRRTCAPISEAAPYHDWAGSSPKTHVLNTSSPPLSSSSESMEEDEMKTVGEIFIGFVEGELGIINLKDKERVRSYAAKYDRDPQARESAIVALGVGIDRVKADDTASRKANKKTWTMKVQQSIVYAEEELRFMDLDQSARLMAA